MIERTLYINKKNTVDDVLIAQGSYGIQLGITLLDYSIPSNSYAEVYAEKPSGAYVLRYATLDIAKNKIIIDIDDSMTDESGTVNLDFKIFSAGAIVVSPAYEIIIEESSMLTASADPEDDQILAETVEKLATAETKIASLESLIKCKPVALGVQTSKITLLKNFSFAIGNHVHLEAEIQYKSASTMSDTLLSIPLAFKPDRTDASKGIARLTKASDSSHDCQMGFINVPGNGIITQSLTNNMETGDKLCFVVDYAITLEEEEEDA